jgi:hypothetical protein
MHAISTVNAAKWVAMKSFAVLTLAIVATPLMLETPHRVSNVRHIVSRRNDLPSLYPIKWYAFEIN